MLPRATYDICQFVAEYFGEERAVDYSQLGDTVSWTDYVENVADAGALFDEIIEGFRFGEWYEVLEQASLVLEKYYLTRKKLLVASDIRSTLTLVRDAYNDAECNCTPYHRDESDNCAMGQSRKLLKYWLAS